MKSEFMSSEESENDTLIVYPLPWQLNYVNVMFKKIDFYCVWIKSSQSKRQRKERKLGDVKLVQRQW